jgi:two-component system, cell cycle sensor histidine kinase and response regulator CckA
MRLLRKSHESELDNDMTLQPCAFPSPNPNDRPRRRTILLVEDEPFIREVTCSILESAGFEVLSAPDVREAITVYEQCPRGIDLLLTDMVLPGGTGPKLGEDLRRRSPEIVVLVTSGYSHRDDLETPESNTYFLAKPYSRRTLVDKIEKILRTEPLHQSAAQAG